MLEPGDPAPPFTLEDQDGREVALEDFRGRPVVVYFYPKDGSPGCTAQACDVRDRWSEFERAGAAVLGISPDDTDAHGRFAAEHELPQVLLADPDHRVLEAYGAWGEKNLYGRVTVGVIRSAVLVGPDGRIARRWRRIGARQHAERVLAALADLAA